MSLCRSGDVHSAFKMCIDAAHHQQLTPNTYTLFALLVGCRETHELALSTQIWSELTQRHNIVPDVNCYQIRIALMSKARDKSELHNLVREWKLRRDACS